jgi:hypothetical protein
MAPARPAHARLAGNSAEMAAAVALPLMLKVVRLISRLPFDVASDAGLLII